MSLVTTLPPTAMLVSATEAATHSRISTADGLESARLQAAIDWVQSRTWRQLVLATIEERMDTFPDVIELQRGPVRAVESVKYVDTAGTLQTLSSSLYQVDTHSDVGRIAPAYGQVWPSLYGTQHNVRVVYHAGHVMPFTMATSTGLVTATGHWFSDTDPVPIWNTGGALPTGTSATTYYVLNSTAGTVLYLAATSGGAAVVPTTTGTGTHFLGECPWWARAAILLLFAELNERREQAIAGTIIATVELAAQNLVDPYRLPL